MTDKFRISHALVDQLFAQARAEAPREACGMIGGLGRRATAVYPTKNTDTSNITYKIDPQEAFAVIRRMRDDGADFIASYHSHPETQAYPSPTDRAEAGDSELVYVIASLRRPDNTELRAYEIKAGEVNEVEVVIDE